MNLGQQQQCRHMCSRGCFEPKSEASVRTRARCSPPCASPPPWTCRPWLGSSQMSGPPSQLAGPSLGCCARQRHDPGLSGTCSNPMAVIYPSDCWEVTQVTQVLAFRVHVSRIAEAIGERPFFVQTRHFDFGKRHNDCHDSYGPFLSTIVSKNWPLSLGFRRFTRKIRIPGKNGKGRYP